MPSRLVACSCLQMASPADHVFCIHANPSIVPLCQPSSMAFGQPHASVAQSMPPSDGSGNSRQPSVRRPAVFCAMACTSQHQNELRANSVDEAQVAFHSKFPMSLQSTAIHAILKIPYNSCDWVCASRAKGLTTTKTKCSGKSTQSIRNNVRRPHNTFGSSHAMPYIIEKV